MRCSVELIRKAHEIATYAVENGIPIRVGIKNAVLNVVYAGEYVLSSRYARRGTKRLNDFMKTMRKIYDIRPKISELVDAVKTLDRRLNAPSDTIVVVLHDGSIKHIPLHETVQDQQPLAIVYGYVSTRHFTIPIYCEPIVLPAERLRNMIHTVLMNIEFPYRVYIVDTNTMFANFDGRSMGFECVDGVWYTMDANVYVLNDIPIALTNKNVYINGLPALRLSHDKIANKYYAFKPVDADYGFWCELAHTMNSDSLFVTVFQINGEYVAAGFEHYVIAEHVAQLLNAQRKEISVIEHNGWYYVAIADDFTMHTVIVADSAARNVARLIAKGDVVEDVIMQPHKVTVIGRDRIIHATLPNRTKTIRQKQ